jgi:DNA modification methylase
MRWKGWDGNQIETRYSHWIWRQYASCHWDDIRLNRVLPFIDAKDDQDEKHLHPTQLDPWERCVHLWSNFGEVVFTPFMGVGTEVAAAIDNGRKGIGVELKPSYYRQAQRNLAHVMINGLDDTAENDMLDLRPEEDPAIEEVTEEVE